MASQHAADAEKLDGHDVKNHVDRILRAAHGDGAVDRASVPSALSRGVKPPIVTSAKLPPVPTARLKNAGHNVDSTHANFLSIFGHAVEESSD